MAYSTNFIDLNKPAKVLSLNVTSISGETYWPHNDGAGDKWWSSGTNPKYYQWEIVATVTAQAEEPEAMVTPQPLSQTFILTVEESITSAI